MGQAKARGSKDQRVAEAVERARVSEIARNMRKEAERKAFAEAQEAARAAREKALEDAASVSEDTVTALCGLPDVDRLIALGDDIASNIRALKGGTA